MQSVSKILADVGSGKFCHLIKSGVYNVTVHPRLCVIKIQFLQITKNEDVNSMS